MAEYIEREKAIQSICTDICKADGNCGHTCREVAAIERIPAADVRPVVRGRNICNTVDGHCEFKCSVCGVEISSVYGGDNDFGLDGGYFNFCPNCGADMREES